MSQRSNIARRRKSALSVGGTDYKAKRAELVLLAAQLFKEKGYKSTTLADIAQHAGLDRATLYYYVSSKEELFREAVKGILDENLNQAERLLEESSLKPTEKLHQLMLRLMLSYDESYPHMYVYIQEEMHEVSNEPTPWAKEMMNQTRRFEAVVKELIGQCIADGAFRNDVSERLAANALFGMFNWTHRWYDPKGPQTAEEIAETFWSIFFAGMAPKQPGRASGSKK